MARPVRKTYSVAVGCDLVLRVVKEESPKKGRGKKKKLQTLLFSGCQEIWKLVQNDPPLCIICIIRLHLGIFEDLPTMQLAAAADGVNGVHM